MRKIVEKLEERGYSADKELALKVFDELNTRLRHESNLLIAIPGVLIAFLGLVRTSPTEIDLAAATVWAWRLTAALSSKRLLRQVVNLLGGDPALDFEDLDFWMTAITSGLLLAVALLLSFR